MASPSNHRPKAPISKPSTKQRRDTTTTLPQAKELPLRTRIVRDSIKKRIFACLDNGDQTTDIELKSGLTHQRIKHYKRMWKDERHDRRLRSKKKSRRKPPRSSRSSSRDIETLQQLPFLRSRSLACGGRKSELAVPGVKGVGERGKRIRRSAARGLKECEANARTTEDAGLEMMDVQMTKPLEFSQGTENQLVIRLREPTL